jgi:hypothetical protein
MASKSPDDNERFQKGELDPDPFADTVVVEEPKADQAVARIAKLPWVSPDAVWLAAKPEVRPYLFYVPGAPGSLSMRGAGLLPRGKVGMLIAEGGAGKTFALSSFALAIVTRSPWLGTYPADPGLRRRVVLVLGEEDAPELRRRLHAQAAVMKLDPTVHGEDVARILALPGAGLDTLALTQVEDVRADIRARSAFADALFDYLKQEGEKNGGWDAILLDPLSRFAGADVETDNAAATRLVQVLERFTQLPGKPAVLVAHHTNKTSRTSDANKPPPSAADARGSSALTDGARWVAKLESHGDGLAKLTVVKSNYGVIPKEPACLKRGDEGGLIGVTSKEFAEAMEKAKQASPVPTSPPKKPKADSPATTTTKESRYPV